MAERKYLDEFEMGLLENYGIKILKKKYDVNDLIEILPKKWKEYDNWVGIEITYDWSMNEWHCTTPWWFTGGACVISTWNYVKGDTLLVCLLNAVLTLAKRDRRYLSKKYVVEDWKYVPENKD